MLRILKNKKSFIADYIFFVVLITILGIIIVVGSLLHTNINDKWQDFSFSDTSKDIMQQNTTKYYNFFDYIFFTVFFLFIMTLAAGVFLLDTHPFLYWVAVILLGFALIPVAILGNMFDKFTSDSTIGTEAARFTLLSAIFSQPLLIFGIIAFLILIILFSRNR